MSYYYETTTKLVREEKEFLYEPKCTKISDLDAAKQFILYQLMLSDKPQEELWILMLDNKLHLIGTQMISRGSVNQCAANPADILRPVILSGATGFILIHNHPSGDPTASAEDNKLTKTIKSACELLGVQLYDHIIIGLNNFFSYNEAALL